MCTYIHVYIHIVILIDIYTYIMFLYIYIYVYLLKTNILHKAPAKGHSTKPQPTDYTKPQKTFTMTQNIRQAPEVFNKSSN